MVHVASSLRREPRERDQTSPHEGEQKGALEPTADAAALARRATATRRRRRVDARGRDATRRRATRADARERADATATTIRTTIRTNERTNERIERATTRATAAAMTLETPSSLGNDDRAALMIQAAYRRHQARADAGRRAKTTALETLEEHEEAMINKRQTLVRRMNEKLGGGLRGKLTRGLARMRIARALGGKGREDATEEEEEEEAPPLPSLGASALEDIIDSLKRGNVFSLIDAMAILQAATVRFAEEESVNYVNAEPGGSVVVVGDLHGQLHDLLFVLKERGMPSDKVKYVFNGDLVDRGNHGCEIALLLCALKLASPRCVFINRGNHEEAFINIYSGFEEECLQKYDHKVFQMFQSCFDWLPYACVVNESVFVIHGGPPCDEGATVDEVRTLPRGAESARAPVDKKRMQWYKELVWSDPHPEATFIGSVPSHRGAGVLWGKDVSERFLQTNKLEVIIRSHQCVGGGVETCHGGKVFTVFSASRYCGTGENKGAILSFMHGDKTPQPQNALVWSIPSGTGLLGYERIKSERKGKEAVNDAVAQQASEYIIEYKADLYRHWSAVSAKRRGHSHLINLFEWADGLSKVLKIKILWSKVFEKLVKTEHVEMMNGKRYVKWKEFLSEYTVKLRGGCKEWQDHVVSRITSAVLQSGNDLLTAFDEMDADKNGVISQKEFNTALRQSIPSLAILSDAQLAAVWSAFDVDNSGTVDFDEFREMLSNSMQSSEREGKVGVRWSTRTPEKSNASGDADAPNESQWERNLSEAFGRLFYSHRKELYHVWHSNFDLDESKSLAKEDFVSMLRALDESTGKHLFDDEALAKLADGMDINGDGRIDFQEFCANIGRMANEY